MALHKVYEELTKKPIPKSTASVWLNSVPELLQNEELLSELLDKKTVKKDETKYTYDEWCYIHKLEGEKINMEYRALMEKMNNPMLPDEQLMKVM
jgi:hypothetical protein